LLVGMALFVVASVACALAPTVAVLTLTRTLQGLAGAAGVVISRAIVRDVLDGAAVAAMMARLMLVMGLAPILAPLGGSLLLRATNWRGLFVVMTFFAAVLLVGSFLTVPKAFHDLSAVERAQDEPS